MFDQTAVNRCPQPDGSLVFTDKACDALIAAGTELTTQASSVTGSSSWANVFPGVDLAAASPLQFLMLLLLIYVVVSLATFLVHRRNKFGAARGKSGADEQHLHGLKLMAAWPGALASQQSFSRQTGKSSSRRVFCMMVVLFLAVWLDYSQDFPLGRALGALIYQHVTGLAVG